MIPSVLARHIEQGVQEFLRPTLPVTTPFFSTILERLLNEPGSVFKGPYLDMQLPFQHGKGNPDYFPDLPMPFPPYLHQEKSFDRLSGPDPQNTIVATGTGSGKTECFLYPILDYCFHHRGEPGIKAIIIYPMNALATDQAGRLAELIHNSKLKGRVTAGIYVGQQEADPDKGRLMGRDHIIFNKETLRLSPPDILLTNYKMLDYLLIRPEDRLLWEHNGSETLRFLVVDELHTFDGAQGSDLACLIRRLKARLGIEPGYLCGVGTSATLGGSEEHEELPEYASAVFGESFQADAVISESRLSAGEFLGDNPVPLVDIISPDKADKLDPAAYNQYEDYIKAQYQLWFNEPVQNQKKFSDPAWRTNLAAKLKEHLFFHNLLKILGGNIHSFDDIFIKLEKVTRGLKNTDHQYRVNMLNSLLTLVSEACFEVVSANDDGRTKTVIRLFLDVRVQLWMRELRRMVASVDLEPVLRFADDLNEEQLETHLPLVHCRECGAMGWAGMQLKNDSKINGDLLNFYRGFFKKNSKGQSVPDPKLVYLFPEEKSRKVGMYFFCPHCLHVTSRNNPVCCPSCEHKELILVFKPDTRHESGKFSKKICPYCNAQNSLTIVGSRAASLTSVMIVQLYSSTYNDDKKLLTFSDNVQDAAHRAGFFNGRTYRFNFRTALQKVIMEKGDGRTLAELAGIFTAYWLGKIPQNRYIATFLAPDMEWLNDYEYLQKHGGQLPEESTLMQNVNKRIGWEIVSEYGFRARIGRTLEKTSSSVVYLDQERLAAAMRQMLEPIRNEIGHLRELDKGRLKKFLLGLIVHLKNQGGIYQPYLSGYLECFGSYYLLNRRLWMPNFGPNSRAPSFLTTRNKSRFDRIYSSTPTHRTWYEAWAEKCFLTLSPFVLASARELYDLVLEAFTAEVILEEKTAKGETVWGLKPEALRVSARVSQLRCKKCGHNISVAEEESEFFAGAPCQRFHCSGKYDLLETGADYYGKLYATGNVERIIAREHTGLLKRKEREQLETEFKADGKDRFPWYPNLLSCTPTLEMGIDIGNLSSLVLCSVPPAQANYLQRIGRAGRRDGNALSLTVANGRPHDLYFFAEPEEMLAGRIDSPGIFLDASAVLERQFTAYCFDCWIAANPDTRIPRKLGQVLNNLEPVDKKKFPHNFINYIETNQADFFARFVALFSSGGSRLSEESTANLKIFVAGDEDKKWFLRGRIMNGLHSRSRERESLRKKVRTLTAKIRTKKKAPKDKNYEDELRELMIEKSALQALVKNISDKNTFNFFTDEGLLPNYAFPEVGVMLNSLIYRKKTRIQEGESSYDSWTYEYERPARSAIVELAPANIFYAEGRKIKIDQVDMSVSKVATWRFCDNCSHKERIDIEAATGNCPNCGSSMWGDAGQKKKMLKMRQVFASTSDQKSRISDDSDDRDPVFYNKQMLVEFDDKQVMEAYKVEADFPFGFDFLSKVDFCEINFGERTEIGEKSSIAGEEMSRQGFTLCQVCGKVQGSKNNKSVHAFTCTARNQESDKNFIDSLYLYRQFMSEAIRILLPVSIISESERKLQSFIAAIQLGLKKRFRGKIDHLQTTIHEEPIPESSFRKKYLVLYDTVPGGTGYLKQLMRSEHELMEVLELALQALKSCTCNREEGKDGCYRCLYAYRNSYNMPETSRDTAILLLAEILSHKDKLVKTKDNISEISLNTYLESELEARFIGALKNVRANMPVQLKKELVNGKPGYFLKVGNRAYYIEPQVKLGELAGVSIESRADFVIRSARLENDMKPIVLFLDGYTYHRDRIGKDMAQRMAIVQSDKFLVWSLSWHDVENNFKLQNKFFIDFLEPTELPAGENFKQLLAGYGVKELKRLISRNSFDLLLHFLESPDQEKWRKFIFIVSLLHADPVRFGNEAAVSDWTEKVETFLSEDMAEKIKDANCPCLYGEYQPPGEQGHDIIRQSVIIEQKAVNPPGKPLGIRIGCCLDDSEKRKDDPDFQAGWNGFLRLYNFYQFLPYSYFVTTDGLKNKAYDGLRLHEELMPESAAQEPQHKDSAWTELKELTEKEFHNLLDKLEKNKWPVPEAGYELEGAGGEIIGSAELAWEDLQLAFLTEVELEYGQSFIDAGWEIISLQDVLENSDKYMNLKDNLGK